MIKKGLLGAATSLVLGVVFVGALYWCFQRYFYALPSFTPKVLIGDFRSGDKLDEIAAALRLKHNVTVVILEQSTPWNKTFTVKRLRCENYVIFDSTGVLEMDFFEGILFRIFFTPQDFQRFVKEFNMKYPEMKSHPGNRVGDAQTSRDGVSMFYSTLDGIGSWADEAISTGMAGAMSSE